MSTPPDPQTMYWYKFCASNGRGVFKATPAQIKVMLDDENFKYCTFSGTSDTVASHEFTIICRADEVAFDFSVGENPVEEFLELYTSRPLKEDA